MANHLTNFDFNANTIRVVDIDGEPWFVAIDTYKILFGRTTGLNTRTLLSDEEIRILMKREVSDLKSLTSLFSGAQYRLALVSESGLYKLIMRSDKREARAFQDWVTQVVLPTIRKDGGYISGEEKFAAGRKCSRSI